MPYAAYKIYGPYTRKDGRQIVIARKDKVNLTISYPKFLVETRRGCKLAEGETIDHIDRNTLNNSPDNLQILLRSDHVKLDTKRLSTPIENCLWCKKLFKLTKHQVRNSRRIKIIAGPFCSRKCSGEYGRALQLNRTEVLSKEIETNYTSRKEIQLSKPKVKL